MLTGIVFLAVYSKGSLGLVETSFVLLSQKANINLPAFWGISFVPNESFPSNHLPLMKSVYGED